jgi:hypothetical protein
MFLEIAIGCMLVVFLTVFVGFFIEAGRGE